MMLWSIALAVVGLLSAWGAANWRMFHLAYCQHLMSSKNEETRNAGVAKICHTHLRAGMKIEEVRRKFHPVEVAPDAGAEGTYSVAYPMYVEGVGHQGWITLCFDENGGLTKWSTCGPNIGK